MCILRINFRITPCPFAKSDDAEDHGRTQDLLITEEIVEEICGYAGSTGRKHRIVRFFDKHDKRTYEYAQIAYKSKDALVYQHIEPLVVAAGYDRSAEKIKQK